MKFFLTFEHIRAQIFKREIIIWIFEQIEIHSLNIKKIIKFLRAKQKTAVRI
jgi:hypothetical protein